MRWSRELKLRWHFAFTRNVYLVQFFAVFLEWPLVVPPMILSFSTFISNEFDYFSLNVCMHHVIHGIICKILTNINIWFSILILLMYTCTPRPNDDDNDTVYQNLNFYCYIVNVSTQQISVQLLINVTTEKLNDSTSFI